MIVLDKVNFGERQCSQMRLKIVVPEDLEYQSIFDEILNEYTSFFKLNKIKTTEFGSLFEISYDIAMKDESDSKIFIDKLRCKNGKLSIVLHMREDNKPSVF